MIAIYNRPAILIELTNACINQCSNCTRLCGHHKEPFFMDWETFKKSVDNTNDFNGQLGIMGGEPTLHPRFSEYVRYLRSQRPPSKLLGAVHPLPDVDEYIRQINFIKNNPKKEGFTTGLWTTLCSTYYKHYELIQDTFTAQIINDQKFGSRHQAILMARRDFNIPDKEWEQLLDKCWWQCDVGSASITPKGAFFCEVAGAIDMLFDGPGGWPIEPGWWKRGPEDFKDQFHLCELCAMPFTKIDRDAREQIDDVSPTLYNMLEQLGSPKLKRGSVVVHENDMNNDSSLVPRDEMLFFLGRGALKYQSNTLYPQRIACCVYITNPADIHEETLRQNKEQFNHLYLLTANEAVYAALHDIYPVIYRAGASPCALLAEATRKETDWVILLDADQFVDAALRDILTRVVFNPGSFHRFNHNGMRMFNVLAAAWRKAGFDGVAHLGGLDELPSLWEPRKVIDLAEGFEKVVIPDLAQWREVITHANPRDNGVTWARYATVAAKHEIDPLLAQWREHEGCIVEKLRALDSMRFSLTPPDGIVNKLRTAIHNLLAEAISKLPSGTDKMQETLLDATDSYCVRYALAMLTVGTDKEHHLAHCVLNPENIYNLGLSTLKLHYESLNPLLYQEQAPQLGIVSELLSLTSTSNPVIILGNRYPGTSIAMLLTAAGRKPLAFADDSRNDFAFRGIPTLLYRDILANHASSPILISEIGTAASYLYTSLRDKGFEGEILMPHRLTLLEMNKVPIAISKIYTNETSPNIAFGQNIVIPDEKMAALCRLRKTTGSTEDVRALLS